MSELTDQIKDRVEAAKNYLADKRVAWDEYENIFHNRLDDDLSNTAKSQVFDPKLSTFIIERSARVMSQLPTGKAKPISRNDQGASLLMNLILEKYVLRNANAQFDFLTKLRMLDLYSNIYGNFFGLVDWDVKKNGYVGPDLWLIPIRDVFPQVGAISIDDSDYCIIRTWRSLEYFKSLKNKKNYKDIDTVIALLEKKSGDKDQKDSDDQSQREANEYPDAASSKKSGYFEIYTMFERDRWVDYVKAADIIIRDIKNPHETNEIPIVNKYSIPLIDDFMGMGDFERGKSMQYARNSLWNLYLDAIKISIFPPVMLDKNGIIPTTIKWSPAAKWLLTKMGSAQVLNLTPQGIQSFNNTSQAIDASMLNTFGTTNTAVSANVDPGFGKTPEALKLQANRESSRDNWDRYFMEKCLEQIMRKFTDLISKKMPETIKIRMFEDEIKAMANKYEDIEEMYDEKTGKLLISKSKVGNTMYDYELVSGSTYAVDQQKQLAALVQLIEILPKFEQILVNEGKKINYGEYIARIMSNSGIQDWDKIIEEVGEENRVGNILEQDKTRFMQLLQQMQSGQIPVQNAVNNETPQAQGAPQEGGGSSLGY
jgi:hypothetical protein